VVPVGLGADDLAPLSPPLPAVVELGETVILSKKNFSSTF
jgi:hypothetical protein